MTCKHCNSATYNCNCIKCVARLILTLPFNLRKQSIEMQDRFDIDALKAEVIEQDKKK